MNLTAFQETYQQRALSINQDKEINIFVANALRFLIQNVFETLTSTFICTISAQKQPIEYWCNDILEKLIVALGGIAVQMMRVNIRRQQLVRFTERKYCNFLMVDSFQSLVDIDIASGNAHYDGLEYYLIFLQARDRYIPHEMDRILQYCLDNYWLHCNVMIQNEKGEVLMYTYFPFTPDHCYKANAQLIDRFDGVKFQNVPLFPNKLLDIHNCPLRVDTWHQPPYVDVQYLEDGSPYVTGMDIDLLLGLRDVMHFSLDMVIINWDDVVMNESWIGPFKWGLGSIFRGVAIIVNIPSIVWWRLRDRKTNISLGYFRRTPTRDILATSTVPIYHVNLVAVMIRSKQILPSFTTFAYPFDNRVWTCLIFSLLALVAINRIRRNILFTTSFQFFEILMGVTASIKPVGIRNRLKFLLWVWCSFVLRSVYQSLMFYLYSTDSYRTPPTSLEALADGRFTLICNAKTVQFINSIPHFAGRDLPVISLASEREMDPLFYLDEQSNDQYVAIIGRDMAQYYNTHEKHRNQFEILPFNVNDLQVTIYLPKHSFFSEVFNDNILRFASSGLFKQWYNSRGNQYELRNGSTSDITRIHLLGVVKINTVVYLAALVVFIMELLSLKYKIFKKCFE